MNEPNLSDVREALMSVTIDARITAEMHIQREMTDYLGRMSTALSDVEDVFDEYPDSPLDAGQAERAHEAFMELASLALAQAAFLQAQFPNMGADDE